MNCETIILITMIESSKNIRQQRMVTIVISEFDYGVTERDALKQ
jgi:hypothetical protein